MYLLSDNVVHYLMAHGLLDASAVVRGGLVISENSSRCRNYSVQNGRTDTGLFLKQAMCLEPLERATLDREGAYYRLVQGDARYAALAEIMPPFLDHDPAQSVLVLGLIQDAQNLDQYFQKKQAFPPWLGALVGTVLGHFHGQPATFVDRHKNLFPQQIPWILLLKNQAGTTGLSKGNTRLIEVLRAYPGFMDQLEELRTQWQRDCLIHGDIKWSNMLLQKENGRHGLRIIDWELVDFGDACWDLGGVFQAYLCTWIFFLHHGSQQGSMVDRVLNNMQANIHAFWSAYGKARNFGSKSSDALLIQSMRYGAARLVQTAFEVLYRENHLTQQAGMMLQVAANILARPEAAANDLFGFHKEAA